MAQGPGRTPRAAAKPGGGTRRRRGTGSDRPTRGGTERDNARAERSDRPDRSVEEPAGRSAGELIGAAQRRVGLTTRALALGVVLLLLAISYASSLRVFFDQQRQLAAADAEIAARQQRITDLEDELERWNDPAYVRAQARERLGWAVPGEVGYIVVGPDGKPLVPGAEIQPQGATDRRTWWQRLDGSMTAADQPDAEPTAAPTPAPAPRTVAPSPSPTPTPSR